MEEALKHVVEDAGNSQCDRHALLREKKREGEVGEMCFRQNTEGNARRGVCEGGGGGGGCGRRGLDLWWVGDAHTEYYCSIVEGESNGRAWTCRLVSELERVCAILNGEMGRGGGGGGRRGVGCGR